MFVFLLTVKRSQDVANTSERDTEDRNGEAGLPIEFIVIFA